MEVCLWSVLARLPRFLFILTPCLLRVLDTPHKLSFPLHPFHLFYLATTAMHRRRISLHTTYANPTPITVRAPPNTFSPSQRPLIHRRTHWRIRVMGEELLVGI
jgi:hypothetical protein